MMEATMEAREKSYRDVLEELAISRGFEGAEEVARQAARLGPRYSVEALLEEPPAGFGVVLDEVLHMSDTERERVVSAFAGTFMRPSPPERVVS